MQLPRELSTWADLLMEFPFDTACELGSLIFRMSVAIGPMRHGQLSGIEEPDGFGGLAATGAIEHLLPSEWLLADEVPIEFDRRAAMGEQLYYRLNRIDYKKGLTSVLLFDAGPSKLGVPSIVHLALLILFIRRAESAHADFYWGILQDPGTGLLQSSGKEAVNHLINVLTPHTPSPEDIRTWHDHLETLSTQPGQCISIDDLHVIGDAHLKKTFPTAGLITINDTFDHASQALEVIIRKKDSERSQALELNPPPAPLCVKILRDPYATIKDEPSRTDITLTSYDRISDRNAPLFSQNSLKVAITTGNGNLELWSIPNSPSGDPGQSKHFFPVGCQTIVGVEIVKRSIRTITADGERVYFNRFPSINAMRTTIDRALFPFPESHGTYRQLYSTTSDIVITNNDNRLYRVPTKPLAAPKLITEQITGHFYVNHNIVYASKDPSGEKVVVSCFGSDAREHFILKNGASGQVFFAEDGWLHEKNAFGLMAINTSGRMWTLKNGKFNVLLNPPGDSEVVGLTSCGPQEEGAPQNTPALVLLESDRKRLSLLNVNTIKDIYTSASEISQISVDSRYGQIAFITKRAELIVFSVKRNAVVLHVISGDGP